MKPNDNAKVVVLIVAVVAVIGFAGYRVLGTQGKPIEDAGAAVERIDAPDAGSASGGSGGEVVRVAALPLSSIDPFGKPVPEAPPIIPVATRSTSSRPIRAYDPPIREFGGDLRLEPAVVPGRTARLEGLIVGKEGLAIISIGTEMHYLYQDSEAVSGIKVQSIESNRATLRIGSRTFKVAVGDTFTVGGSQEP